MAVAVEGVGKVEAEKVEVREDGGV